MSRARDLSKLGNINVLSADDVSNEVGIATTVPRSTLDVRGEIKVGTAIQAGSAGVVTATSFSGSGANLTGIANTETVRTDTLTVAGVSTLTGAVNVDATTDSTSTTTGALIVDGGLGVAKNVYIGAGLSVAGTLTYEDVTNVDSVGVVTAKSGVNITGGELTVGSGITMGIAGVATFSGTSDVHLTDGVKAKFGDSGDLEIFHNGSHSIIADVGTGNLQLRAADFRVTDSTNAEVMIKANTNEGVELYYDNAKKFETVTGGATITGVCTATSFAGDGSSLTGLQAGATGGNSGANAIFRENEQTVTHDYTITNARNAGTWGPVTINSGVTVTVGDGEYWTIM